MSEAPALLTQTLTWIPVPGKPGDYVTTAYKGSDCFLRLGDFPEEALYALHFRDEVLEFDDAPKQWTILTPSHPDRTNRNPLD